MDLPWARMDSSGLAAPATTPRSPLPARASEEVAPASPVASAGGPAPSPRAQPGTEADSDSAPRTPPRLATVDLSEPDDAAPSPLGAAGANPQPQTQTPTQPPTQTQTPAQARSRLADPAVFWAEHETWLADARRVRPKSVTVSDPQQGPRSLTSPTGVVTYLVALDPPLSPASAAGVRRRYSDFETLRAHLHARFAGILLPALPEKRVLVTGKSEDFLQDRQRGLLTFLERIVADPYLFLDASTRAFLSASPAEWDMARKTLTAGLPVPGTLACLARVSTGVDPDEDAAWNAAVGVPSVERWRAAVSMCALPEDADAQLARARASLGELEDALKSLLASLAKVAAVARQHAAAVADVARAVGGPAPAPAAGAGGGASSATSVLAPLAGPLRSWGDAAQLEPVLVEELLLERVADELDLVREMRVLVEQRDAEAQAADRALRGLHKLEVERESFEKIGQLDKAAKVGTKLQEAQRMVKAADYKVEFATKALFYAGLPGFVPARVKAVGLVFVKLAIGQVRFGELTKSIWLGFVSAAGVDMDEIASEPRTVLAMEAVEARAGGVFRGVFAQRGVAA